MSKLKGLILPLITVILLLTACTNSITFTAVIEEVFENGIMVKTSDDVGFNQASVSFDKSCKINFNLVAGQTVEIKILPEIRESYPVQVTAVDIKLKTDKEDKNPTVEYKKITGDEAAKMMQDEVIILDVRTQDEFNEGHVKNAVLLPDYEVKDRAVEILPDKNQTILVYCRTGRRSEIASKELISMGYTAVYDFGGITTDWNGEVVK